MTKTIYAKMKDAGLKIDHYRSNLYVRKSKTATKILNGYDFKNSVTTFRDNIDGEIWYEIPLAYDPFWK